MTNHEQAKAYMCKQNLLGTENKLSFSLIEPDYVSMGSNNEMYNTTDRVVIIPKFVTHLGASAFRNHETIEKVKFIDPLNIKSIGVEAFSGCKWLKEIELPPNIKKIKENTFEDCDLRKITIPNNCEIIDSMAFEDCRLLETIEIDRKNSKLESIDYHSFAGCFSLEKIVFPESIKIINHRAFFNAHHEIIGYAPKEIVKKYKKKLLNLRLMEYND